MLDVLFDIGRNCSECHKNITRREWLRYLILNDIENNVCTRVTNCISAHEGVHFGVYFPSCEATRVINTIVTLEWAEKQFVTRVHTLFYFLHDTTNPVMTIKTTIFTHCPRVSFARFSFYWWRHNRSLLMSQWPDNCDAVTWIVISNSLDIDLIHGDIHGRSCKKIKYPSMSFSNHFRLLVWITLLVSMRLVFRELLFQTMAGADFGDKFVFDLVVCVINLTQKVRWPSQHKVAILPV